MRRRRELSRLDRRSAPHLADPVHLVGAAVVPGGIVGDTRGDAVGGALRVQPSDGLRGDDTVIGQCASVWCRRERQHGCDCGEQGAQACAAVTSRGAGWWSQSWAENRSASCERVLRPWTAGCLIVVIGLAGCGGGATTKGSESHAGYPRGIKQSFLAGCERTAKVDKAIYCRCLLSRLEVRYSQAGFEALSSKERLATVKSIATHPFREGDRHLAAMLLAHAFSEYRCRVPPEPRRRPDGVRRRRS